MTEQKPTLNEEESNWTLPPIKTTENPEHRLIETVFLPALLDDNPKLLERDPGYKDRLFQQGARIANALLDGDWSVFAGQFLSQFAYHRHTCERFDVPRSWTRFRGYDWGFAAPCCCLWFAKEPSTGRIYLYRELYESQLTDPQQAEKINDMTEPWERFTFTFADPAVWAKKTTDIIVTSTFEVFLQHQIYLTKADNSQERKAARIRMALGDIHDNKPGIIIFRNCTNTITEIEGLMSDPDRPDRLLRGQADHAYDALCYALTNYVQPKVTVPLQNFKKTVDNPFRNMEGI